jgi:hypothetical protein
MAVDDRQKRASAVSFLVYSRVPGVDNTSMDTAERIAAVWSYSGILAPGGAPAGVAFGTLPLLGVGR